jgi:ABC-type sugar transport system permease subunit
LAGRSSLTAVGSVGRVRDQTSRRARTLAWPYLLVAPAVAALLVFIYFPIYRGARLSLTDFSLQRPTAARPVGLDNYADTLTSDRFWQIAVQTLVWTAGSVAGSVVVGVAGALLLFGPIRGRAIFRGLLLMPWVAPPVVSAFVWSYLYRETGPLVPLLARLGIGSDRLNFLSDLQITFLGFALPLWAVIQVGIWSGFPFVLVSTLAGLAAIPRDLYEAAALDGASGLQMFWRITLPLISPVLGTTITLLAVWRFAGFDLPFLLTKGGPLDASNVLGVFVYNTGFVSFKVGLGAAMGLTLFVLLIPISLAYVLRSRRDLLGR